MARDTDTQTNGTYDHKSPILVKALEGGYRVAHCLSCGAAGPVEETSEAAHRALSWQPLVSSRAREASDV